MVQNRVQPRAGGREHGAAFAGRQAMKTILLTALTALAAGGAAPLDVTIATKGSSLGFDHETLAAKANQPIRLTFKNNADKDSGLNHSWVLTKPGKDQAVADAMKNVDPSKGIVPDSPDIIAHTNLVKPGTSQTITFTAPAQPGKYPYICTTAGHASTMHGTLEVTK
jgi:azurin